MGLPHWITHPAQEIQKKTPSWAPDAAPGSLQSAVDAVALNKWSKPYGPDANSMDTFSGGYSAKSPIARGAGRAVGSLFAGNALGTVGSAAALGGAAAATSGETPQPEQLSGPVDQPTADNSGVGGDLPQLTSPNIGGPSGDAGMGDFSGTSSEFSGGNVDAGLSGPMSFDPNALTGGQYVDPGMGGVVTPGPGTGAANGPSAWADFGAKALKYGPLALGGASAIAQKVAYNRAAAHINAIGGPQRDLGNQLIAQYNSGTLNASDQAALDRWQATASAQSRQYFANSGQGSSTAALQAQRDIGSQANAMRAQMLQNMLTQGTNLLNIADRYQLAAVQAELSGDTALAGSLGTFMAVYAKFLATNG